MLKPKLMEIERYAQFFSNNNIYIFLPVVLTSSGIICRRERFAFKARSVNRASTFNSITGVV